MQSIKENSIYESFREFVSSNGISNETIESAFGSGYFERNPMYHNDRVITRLLKYIGRGELRAKAEYPTPSSVQFRLVKAKKTGPIGKIIKRLTADLTEYRELVDNYEKRGTENLDYDETEYYGAYLGKVELLESIIPELKKC
jgi:hypothetical protein